MGSRVDVEPQKTRTVLIASIGAAVVAGGVYLRTLHPGLPGPDSGELITVAHVLGIAHPPGYPIFTLLAHGFGVFVPWGPYAWKINLLSALLHAATVGVVCAVIWRLTGRLAAGLAGALALAFSRPFWKGALVGEVFPLNTLMAALLWFCFALLLRDAGLLRAGAGQPTIQRPRRPWPMAGMLAISCAIPAHHHTLLILAVPLAGVALAITLGPERLLARWLPGFHRPYALGGRHVVAGVGLALLGLAPLAYLPLAIGRDPALRWGRPDTPSGFVEHLTRAEYGSFSMAAAPGQVADVHHGWLYLKEIPRDFGWLAAALTVLGLLRLVHRALRGPAGRGRGPEARPLLIVLLGVAVLLALFFTGVPFPSHVPYYRSVVERFHAMPHVTVALVLGMGAAALLDRVPAVVRAVASPALILLAGTPPFIAHFGNVDQRGNRFLEDLGRNTLASLPRNAVLFLAGDVFSGSLNYLTMVEGERPDVVLVNQAQLPRGWYVQLLRRRYPGLLPPFTTSAVPDSDRYRGDSMSANLRWIDHLRGRRPVAFLGWFERSFEIRYAMMRNGLVTIPIRTRRYRVRACVLEPRSACSSR